MDLKDKLKVKMQEIKTKEILNTEEVFFIDTTNFDFGFCELGDEKVTSELKSISLNLFQLKYKGFVEIGSLLNKAFTVLSSENLYEKWLKGVDINKKTALRYRKRAELYNLVEEKDKAYIASLPQKIIDKIFSDRTLLENLHDLTLLEEHSEKKEIAPVLLEQEELNEEFIERTTNDILDVLESLDIVKKKKVQSYLIKIEEIINS